MYEVSNNGGWYNFGFLLGAAIALGGSGSTSCKRRRKKSAREKEWSEIAEKVEEKVRKGIKNWADEEDKKQDDWKETGKKIEEKIKRELRKWAEK
jgi:flagellar motility protein MotE (MotC chaperone)